MNTHRSAPFRAALGSAVIACAGACGGANPPGPPRAVPAGGLPPVATEKKPVTNEYHGVKVTDPYRWLEDSSDPSVKTWSQAQTARARAHLDRIPSIDAVRGRLTQRT